MAKVGNDSKTKKNEGKPKRSFFKDDRIRFTFGLLVLFFSLYLTIAFVSYLFSWQSDQSFQWQSIFSDSSVSVHNWAGKVGASFASQFLNRWFGIASFAIPFLIGIIGLRLLKIRLLPLRSTILKSLLGMVLVSLLFGFLFGNAGNILGSGLGGAHGLFISEWLIAFVGKAGTLFLLIVACTAYLFYLNVSILPLYKRIALAAISLFKVSPNNKDDGSDRTFSELDGKDDQSHTADSTQDTNERTDQEPFCVLKSDNADDYEENASADGSKDEELDGDDVEDSDEAKRIVTTDDVEMEVNINLEENGDQQVIVTPEFYDPTKELSAYQLPPIELLEDYRHRQAPVTEEELRSNKNKIIETLGNYNIQIAKILATVGPTVTLYEIVPAPGIRISKIKNLEDDIALSLAALGIRIIAPIPGRGTIGIEVPNLKPEVVSMASIIRSSKFQDNKFDLAIALGKTISNETFVVDLAKMPHLLVAGATGQGKSVGLNAIITSLLYKKHPAQLKFVLVDPKKVELTLYNKLERHFLAKLPDSEEAIITDTQKVIYTLNSLCIEMDARYDLLKAAHVRNIKEYNEKFTARRLNPEKGHHYLPYIVVVIDEFADLIMTAGREIETPMARIAQLARAVGIHLIIATQRPTTNIITGVIKANFPARIAFRVSSMIDSRTILDTSGANQLVGKGDMLISTGNDLVRVQCAFIDTPEVERITDFIGNQRGYATAYNLPEYTGETGEESLEVDLGKRDDLFEEAARLVVQYQQGSTSLIQRKLAIGYNRAGRIVDQLEAAEIVGPFEGSKARQVLIKDETSLQNILAKLNGEQSD